MFFASIGSRALGMESGIITDNDIHENNLGENTNFNSDSLRLNTARMNGWRPLWSDDENAQNGWVAITFPSVFTVESLQLQQGNTEPNGSKTFKFRLVYKNIQTENYNSYQETETLTFISHFHVSQNFFEFKFLFSDVPFFIDLLVH